MTEEKGEAIAKIEICDAFAWQNVLADVSINGTHALYFKYEGVGAIDVLEIVFE